MSKQLKLSSTLAVLAMAATALVATVGLDRPANGGANQTVISHQVSETIAVS